MRRIHQWIQVAIIVFNLTVAAIVLSTIWPFAMGDFKIHLPEAEDVDWEYSDGIASLSAPIIIDNGGFYSVQDVIVQISVTNNSHHEIINSTESWGKIPARAVFTETLDVEIDLISLIENGGEWIIFNPDNFDVQSDYFDIEILVNCKYTFKLIKFTAAYQVTIPWNGLIQEISFDEPILVDYSGTYYVRVPYNVTTNDLLQGQASFSVSVYNSTSPEPISVSTEQVNLGTRHSGFLQFQVDPETAFDLLIRSQALTAIIEISFQDFTVETEKSIDWIAPGDMVIE